MESSFRKKMRNMINDEFAITNNETLLNIICHLLDNEITSARYEAEEYLNKIGFKMHKIDITTQNGNNGIFKHGTDTIHTHICPKCKSKTDNDLCPECGVKYTSKEDINEE